MKTARRVISRRHVFSCLCYYYYYYSVRVVSTSVCGFRWKYILILNRKTSIRLLDIKISLSAILNIDLDKKKIQTYNTYPALRNPNAVMRSENHSFI